LAVVGALSPARRPNVPVLVEVPNRSWGCRGGDCLMSRVRWRGKFRGQLDHDSTRTPMINPRRWQRCAIRSQVWLGEGSLWYSGLGGQRPGHRWRSYLEWRRRQDVFAHFVAGAPSQGRGLSGETDQSTSCSPWARGWGGRQQTRRSARLPGIQVMRGRRRWRQLLLLLLMLLMVWLKVLLLWRWGLIGWWWWWCRGLCSLVQLR